jgi:hypothetical protein
MTRPAIPVPRWATEKTFLSGDEVGQSTRLDPGAGTAATGALPNRRVPARYANWLFGGATDWLAHVVDAVDAAMLRNWSRRDNASTGHLVVYRKADEYVYTFGMNASEEVLGFRFFPGRFDSIGTAALNISEPLTIPNTAGLFISAIAISSSGTIVIGGEPASGSNDLRVSTDGTNWLERSTGHAAVLRSLHWCEAAGVFVAGFSGSDNISTSPDGENWTTRTTPDTKARGAIDSNDSRIVVANAGVSDSSYLYADINDLDTWIAGSTGNSTIESNIVWSEFWQSWYAFGFPGFVRKSSSLENGSWSAAGLESPGLGSSGNAAVRAFGRYLLAFAADDDDHFGKIRISADGAISWKNLTRLVARPIGDLFGNYGSVFVGGGIICICFNPDWPNGGTTAGKVLMTHSLESFL